MVKIVGDFNDNLLLGFSTADEIYGKGGHDRIDGGGGNDLLLGNQGDDIIDGGNGRDTLLGGIGSDFLKGGAGGDFLSGDWGFDTLQGGTGNDTFIFNAATAGYDEFGALASDTINDFAVGDVLKFSGYDYGDHLVFVENGANVEVYVDLDGGFEMLEFVESPGDYLAVTVLNASIADVMAASYLDLPMMA